VCACAAGVLIAAAEEQRICELETFGTCEWAISSACVNGTLFCPMLRDCPRDQKGQSSKELSGKRYKNQTGILPGAVISGCVAHHCTFAVESRQFPNPSALACMA